MIKLEVIKKVISEADKFFLKDTIRFYNRFKI